MTWAIWKSAWSHAEGVHSSAAGRDAVLGRGVPSGPVQGAARMERRLGAMVEFIRGRVRDQGLEILRRLTGRQNPTSCRRRGAPCGTRRYRGVSLMGCGSLISSMMGWWWRGLFRGRRMKRPEAWERLRLWRAAFRWRWTSTCARRGVVRIEHRASRSRTHSRRWRGHQRRGGLGRSAEAAAVLVGLGGDGM